MKRMLTRVWMRMVRVLGYPGLAGLALLVPTLALTLWLPRLRHDATEASASLAMKARAAARRLQDTPRSASEVDTTRTFVASFPLLDQNSADLDAIVAAANQHHIGLHKGEYQLKVDPNAPFVTYTATFPIRNDYQTLKDFSADVLTALPHASMDDLRMTREAAATTSLDAVVRFTFFYRSP